MTAPSLTKKAPGPSVRLALIVMGVGFLIGVPCFLKAVIPFVKTVGSPKRVAAPGEVEMHLSPATYLIYERTGTQTGVGGLNIREDRSITIDPTQVSVTSADGATIETRSVGNFSETITQSPAIYTGAVEFRIHDAGDYRIAIESHEPVDVLIARSLADTFTDVAGWIVGAAFGGFVVFVGAVLLIIGFVRRGRADRRAVVLQPPPQPAYQPAYQPTGAPVPGWYADPGGSGRQRYWDGAAWTDHLS